ncbi:MAG: hypothetical protein MK538_02440 [Planctomycetes bacterium]|nr:hypothetical protein [Planctomycetota bacterium]
MIEVLESWCTLKQLPEGGVILLVGARSKSALFCSLTKLKQRALVLTPLDPQLEVSAFWLIAMRTR